MTGHQAHPGTGKTLMGEVTKEITIEQVARGVGVERVRAIDCYDVDEVEKAHPHVPWPLMRAMRNRLVHVYFSVDERLLWETVQNDLPVLVPALQSLLRS